jgi:hypothetical protein
MIDALLMLILLGACAVALSVDLAAAIRWLRRKLRNNRRMR